MRTPKLKRLQVGTVRPMELLGSYLSDGCTSSDLSQHVAVHGAMRVETNREGSVLVPLSN